MTFKADNLNCQSIFKSINLD